MSRADQTRQAIMHALDRNRPAIDSDAGPSRVDITIFYNSRTGLPQDTEVRVTVKSDARRQRDIEADAARANGETVDARFLRGHG